MAGANELDDAERERLLEKEQLLQQLVVGAYQDAKRWDNAHKAIIEQMDALSKLRDILVEVRSDDAIPHMQDMHARKVGFIDALADADSRSKQAFERLGSHQREVSALYELYPEAFKD